MNSLEASVDRITGETGFSGVVRFDRRASRRARRVVTERTTWRRVERRSCPRAARLGVRSTLVPCRSNTTMSPNASAAGASSFSHGTTRATRATGILNPTDHIRRSRNVRHPHRPPRWSRGVGNGHPGYSSVPRATPAGTTGRARGNRRGSTRRCRSGMRRAEIDLALSDSRRRRSARGRCSVTTGTSRCRSGPGRSADRPSLPA